MHILGYFEEKLHMLSILQWCTGTEAAAAGPSQLSQLKIKISTRARSPGRPAQAPTSAHHFSKFRDEKSLKCNSIIFLVHSFISWTRLIGFTVKILGVFLHSSYFALSLVNSVDIEIMCSQNPPPINRECIDSCKNGQQKMFH